MQAQVTFDDRGVSVWPIDTKLKYQNNEWFDIDCRVRGIKDGQVVFCGGNGFFNAMGLPSIAEFDSLEGAMYVCDLHNENPNNSRKYDKNI